MNEAISRALGRAGELEALVHNEVAALEKSYGENEHKIKGLIQELVGERHALVSTTDKVAETLKSMGSEVPNLIEKLSQQQIKLAKIIEGAGQNLIALENQLATASGSLETSLANRTQQLQAVLDDYTVALDATLANRAEALDVQLVERTRALDAAFSERLALFDDSMLRSTIAIDSAVNDKARALTVAMENHVRALSDTLGRQAANLGRVDDDGIDAVRRTSDSITRQSLKAIEGLSSQADLLKNVSENLLHQISGVTNRFDNQGQLDRQRGQRAGEANARIDTTLQKRHGELNDTLQRLSGKAEQLDEVMRGYSATVEGTIANAESARPPAHRAAGARHRRARRRRPQRDRAPARAARDAQSQAVVAEFERLRTQADAQAARAIEDMRTKRLGRLAGGVAAPGLARQPLHRDLGRPARPGVRAQPPACTWSRSACAPRPSACPSPRARAPMPCAPPSTISCAPWSSSRPSPARERRDVSAAGPRRGDARRVASRPPMPRAARRQPRALPLRCRR